MPKKSGIRSGNEGERECRRGRKRIEERVCWSSPTWVIHEVYLLMTSLENTVFKLIS